ncbi:MAG: hypothetical protein GY811_07210 [Myxococcales bacterium]|nr:hypothetical protein [Myxococcales bacterium]
MSKSLLPSSIILASSLFMACADDATDGETYAGSIIQESEGTLADATLCTIDVPCADGLDCLWIDALGIESAICIDAGTACDVLDCGDGECLILESYPGQMMCTGGDAGGDVSGDPGNDCSVSSDGTGSCDDSTDDESEGEESGGLGAA